MEVEANYSPPKEMLKSSLEMDVIFNGLVSTDSNNIQQALKSKQEECAKAKKQIHLVLNHSKRESQGDYNEEETTIIDMV